MPKYYRIPGRGVAEFPDQLSDDEINRYIKDQLRTERQRDVTYGTALDTAMGFLSRGAANIGTGLAKAAESVGWESMGDFLRESSEADKEKFLGLAEMPGSKAAEVGGMLGTTGGLMATRMFPVVGQAIAGAAGAGLGAEEARQRQIEAMIAGKTVTPEQEKWGQLGGAALGALEYFNLPGGATKLAKMLRPGAAAAALAPEARAVAEATRIANLTGRGLAREAGKQAVGEAIEEGIQEGGQNILERFYNPERGVFENVPTSMLLGGVMGGALGGLGVGYARRLARQRGFGGLGADTDENFAVDTAAPQLAQQLGLFGETQPAGPAAPATPRTAEDIVREHLLGGRREPQPDDPFALPKELFQATTPQQEEARPPWEAPPRQSRLSPGELQAKLPMLDAIEAKTGDVVLSFESPLDRAVWLGSRNVAHEERQPFLQLAADLMGGTEAEAEQLGRRLRGVTSKAAKGQAGPLIVPRMIDPTGETPVFTAIPPYRPPVQTAAGRPAQQGQLPLTIMPGLPEPIAIGQRVGSAMTQAATDMGMGRNVRGDFIESLRSDDIAVASPAREVAEAGLDMTNPDVPEEQSHMALWSGMRPGALQWLRDSNWINPKEWSWLQRQAKQTGHLADVRESMPDLPPRQQEALAIRNVMRDRAVGTELPAELEKVYQRSLGALTAAGNSLRAEGISTIADVDARLRPAPEPEAVPPALDPVYAENQQFLNERLKGYGAEQGLVANLMRDIRTGAGALAEGRYVPGRKAIEVLFLQRGAGETLRDYQAKLAGLLDHEFIHYLRRPGEKAPPIFTDRQWATLVRKAEKRGHVAEAQELYANQPGYTQDTIEEEGVANLFRDTATSTAPDGFTARMWDRMTNAIGRVGNAFAGRGWQTADDVFRAIRAGEITQQAPVARAAAAAAAGERYALPVNESPLEAEIRKRRDYTSIREIDAKKFQEAFEEGRGEPLAWNRGRSERLRGLPSFDSYPQVAVDHLGRPDVMDGRHRIAEAARRGERIPVAMHPDSPPLPDELYAVMRKRNMERLPNAIDDLDTVENEFEVSTRNASAVRPRFRGEVLESALGPEILTTGYDSGSRDAKKFETNVVAQAKALNFQDIPEEQVRADPHGAAREMISRMKENLLWLHKKYGDQFGEDIRNRAKLWYDGANRIAKHFAKEFGTSNAQASGVLAVFSPQKDWFQNVDMARRLMDFYKKRNRAKWDSRMDDAFLKPKGKRTKSKNTWSMAERLDYEGLKKGEPAHFVPMFERIRGKRFSEIADPEEQALWFRLHDEATNPREYPVVTPEGDFGKWMLKDDGKTKASMAWSDFGVIEKAFSIMGDGSRENISNQLGDEHKVRNFYNNILVPNSKRGHVTMDTHAVAAALVRALSGEADEVKKNFGGTGTSGSKYTGESGTYFLAAEAYREAARDVGLLPREMQSITWEAVRGLFTDVFKGKTVKDADGNERHPNVEAIDKIWNDHLRGIVTREQARELAYAAAAERKPSKQGIDTPDWATDRGRVRGQNAQGRVAADAGQLLPAAGAGGRPGGDAGRGTGSQPAVAVPASELPLGGGQRAGDLPAGDVRYALPRRDVHVGLKLGHGSPLHRQYGSDIAIPFEAADEVYNKLGKALGVKIKERRNSQGIYEGVTEPSTHLTVTGKQNDIQDFLHAVSYALHQTMTISARPLKNGNGYAVDLVQRNGDQMADSEYAMQVAERIRQVAMEDPDFRRPDGSHMFEEPAPWGTKSLVAGASAIRDHSGRPALRLYNDEGKFSQEQLAALSSIVRDKLGDEHAGLEFDLDHGDVEFKSAYNDWNENPNGENFKDQIIRRDGGLLQQYIDDHIRPLVDRAVDARSRKEGARGTGAPAGAEAAAAPEEVRYALQRGQKPPPQPKPPRLSDTILDVAMKLRGGVPVESAQYNTADLAMAQKLAADKRLSLDRLAKINPDEYLNFDKLDMEERPKEHLRNMVRIAAEAGGWNPKDRIGFDKIKAEAGKLLGDPNILADIKTLKDKETLNPAVRLAYSVMLKNTESEVIRRTEALQKNHAAMSPDQRLEAQREIDALDRHMRQLMNTLLPARSQDGRNLVYHRIVAQGTFNREYWNARVKRLLNLPPQAELPDDVHKPLNDAITNGQIAEQEYSDAKGAMDGAQASGNQQAQAAAKTRLKVAGDKLKTARQKLAQQAAKQEMTKLEAALALWRAGLLTSPPARGLDVLSNASFHGLEKLTNIPAAWIDAAMGQRTGQRSVGSQWKANALKQTWKGFAEGARQAKGKLGEVWRGDVLPDTGTSGKIESYRQFNVGTGRVAQAAKRYHDRVYGVQQATDMPFGQAAYDMGIAEQANIQAMNEHKSGKLPQGVSMAERAQQLIDNPTEEMQTEAEAMKQFMTFSNDNMANTGIQGAKRAIRRLPGGEKGVALIDWVVPFTKVPTNVLARVLDYSPVGVGQALYKTPRIAKQLVDKSLTQKDQRMYAQLWSRGLVGSALQFLGLKLAEAGLMTGIRDERDEGGRLADEAAGRPPSSIRIPGTNQWIQIPRVSPGGNILAAGATLYQNMHKIKDPASLTGAEIGTALKAISDMPFLQGIDMVKDAIDSPGHFGTNLLQRWAGSVVPAGIARLAASVDPVMRDLKDEGLASDLIARTPGSQLAAKHIPGMGALALPERRDVLGREMRQPGATRLGPLIDPFSTKTGYDDAVTNAIVDNQLKLSRLERGDNEPKALYNKRAQLAGEMQYRALLEALQSPEYQMAETAEERREVLKDAKEAATREASGMTTRDDLYRQSTEAERSRMLDEYLNDIRAAAPLQ